MTARAAPLVTWPRSANGTFGAEGLWCGAGWIWCRTLAWRFLVERVTRIELALSAWELDRSGYVCCVTCMGVSPRVTAMDPYCLGVIAR
jgi:hypothetical protein